MKSTRSRKRKIRLLVVIAVFSSLMVTFHSCVTFRMSHQEIDEYFKTRDINASQEVIQEGFREIHYVEAGNPEGPLVVFVHGSPGSLSAFIHFLADTTLLDKATLITTDRPGFGYSNFGVAEPTLHGQAELLKPILEEHKKKHQAIILVGHSLGGPLIARMAMDYPLLIDGLVLVAPSIDPALEPDETWFRAPLASPFLSWIMPRSLRASNEEIYHLKPELEKMMGHWKDITCPVIVIQGTKDSLVDPGNAAFAKAMLENASVEIDMIDGMDHFVPWSNPELIHDAILKLIEKEKAATELSGH